MIQYLHLKCVYFYDKIVGTKLDVDTAEWKKTKNTVCLTERSCL